MGEGSIRTTTTTTSSAVSFDREVEQAIVALKKGAQLLKYGRRGKPKVCPFRLSTDEKLLIWYTGGEERQLSLDSITKIIPGQGTVNFQRQPQPEKESQSFSLIYGHGELSLDLICKSKEQADSWCIGLRALISRYHHRRPFGAVRGHRGAQSCINSPIGYSRRKRNLGILDDPMDYSQVRSLCGSPPRSLADRCLSDGYSFSSESLYPPEPRDFNLQTVVSDDLPVKRRDSYASTDCGMSLSSKVSSPAQRFPSAGRIDVLRDVLVWGEGIEGGCFGSAVDSLGTVRSSQYDALLPKLLESTATLDIQNISFGGKHAALVTKQGEIFCWGQENGGRLGHKINMDASYPKIVESLNGVHVKSASCGEYQTCALTLSGELYSWGDNGIGLGLVDHGSNRSKWLPQRISGSLDGIYVSSVTCGEWHTAVVSSSGQLFTYGDGTFGVLGHGNLQSVSQPKEVESLKGLRVKSVACGPWHTAAIVDIMVDRSNTNSPSGKLFTWGDGDKGRLGHMDRERKLFPTCVAQLVDHDFIQVCCGRMLTVGLTNTGMVCTMGSAAHGQLGNPLAGNRSMAVVQGELEGEFVKDISSGSHHVIVLTSRGKVYTWGKGANGRLGLGDTEDRNIPTLVEALRERQVENIACGSSFSAAICLHKSIICSDQSACSGCKMVFSFTRKKHNCYNCGHLFCRPCSSKKVTNASLAPNKDKLHRVCDSCFNKLTKFNDSDKLMQSDNFSAGQSLLTQKAYSQPRTDNGATNFSQAQTVSPKLAGQEDQGKYQQPLDPVSPLSSGLPRWGQVACPVEFKGSGRDSSMSVDQSTNISSAISPLYSTISPAMSSGKSSSALDKILTEEVQRLRAEAKSLEKECQVKSSMLQQYQQTVEETWMLAKEEAEKCKAAKDIIKVLSARLYSMAEQQSTEREANVVSVLADGVPVYLPKLRQVSTDSPDSENVDSPILFRNTLSSTYEKIHPDVVAGSTDELIDAKTSYRRNVTKTSNGEWVEQDEPGVYITLLTLPSGQKGLKRVRFSRRKFSEKEAQRWWEENQLRIYQKYDIEGLISPKGNKTKS